ncbi:MAG TPA: hypothetical protein VL284_14725 [Thermoanaerobaculia bacterium]|nr:hypothetical protein [Thermoanaerobaculia bacterium]
MRRSRFLPTFFAVLAVAFAIVLVVRLRSDLRQPAIAAAEPTPPPASTSPSPAARLRLPVPSASAPAALPNNRPRIDNRQQETGNTRVATAKRQTATAAPNSKSQSLISRVLAPITKALTSTPKPSGSASAQPRQGSQASSSSPSTTLASSSSSSSETNTSHTAETHTPNDPNSDTTPPQLISIEFVPPQIQDGQSATVVVTATDDLSGVRGISGTISSPSGKALQGFATQRDGDSNRYVGHLLIAKNSEQGVWRVSFLNMSDNASNSVTLSAAQGMLPATAVLQVVSSNSDNTPPVLRNIWVDKRAIQGGEKDTIFVQADDDNSGVALVSAVFHSPSNLARVGAGCQNNGDGNTWQCDLAVPTCVDCGDWQLEQVTLQDKANNIATFRMDNPLVAATKINIAGSACDNTPPVLQSLVLDTNQITLGDRGAVVSVTIAATDDNCGVAGASGQYVGPGAGSGGFFPLVQSGDSGTWTGKITLDPRAAHGIWRIVSIQLTDQGHNLKVYGASDPALANAAFQVR